MIYSLFITPALLLTHHEVHTHGAIAPSPKAGCSSAVPGHVRASVMGLGWWRGEDPSGICGKEKRGELAAPQGDTESWVLTCLDIPLFRAPRDCESKQPEPEKTFFFFYRFCSPLAWEVAGKRRWEEWGRALWPLGGGGMQVAAKEAESGSAPCGGGQARSPVTALRALRLLSVMTLVPDSPGFWHLWSRELLRLVQRHKVSLKGERGESRRTTHCQLQDILPVLPLPMCESRDTEECIFSLLSNALDTVGA